MSEQHSAQGESRRGACGIFAVWCAVWRVRAQYLVDGALLGLVLLLTFCCGAQHAAAGSCSELEGGVEERTVSGPYCVGEGVSGVLGAREARAEQSSVSPLWRAHVCAGAVQAGSSHAEIVWVNEQLLLQAPKLSPPRARRV